MKASVTEISIELLMCQITSRLTFKMAGYSSGKITLPNLFLSPLYTGVNFIRQEFAPRGPVLEGYYHPGKCREVTQVVFFLQNGEKTWDIPIHFHDVTCVKIQLELALILSS